LLISTDGAFRAGVDTKLGPSSAICMGCCAATPDHPTIPATTVTDPNVDRIYRQRAPKVV
jgi:hypothetical protein